ncbi:hypothetical protein ACJJTC_009340 [Scirpophaga incertulas]
MASSRLVVNLDQPEADLIIMAWLNDEDMEQDDESEHPQEVPRNNIPEELLSDPEDECIPSDHDSESECSIDSDCEAMVASGNTKKNVRHIKSIVCHKQPIETKGAYFTSLLLATVENIPENTRAVVLQLPTVNRNYKPPPSYFNSRNR